MREFIKNTLSIFLALVLTIQYPLESFAGATKSVAARNGTSPKYRNTTVTPQNHPTRLFHTKPIPTFPITHPASVSSIIEKPPQTKLKIEDSQKELQDEAAVSRAAQMAAPARSTLKNLAAFVASAAQETQRGGDGGLVLQRAFDGGGKPVVVSVLPESRAWSLPDGGPLLRRQPAGKEYNSRRYVDFFNATALRTASQDGKPRDFIWVRAIREGYEAHVDADGNVSNDYYNEGYYSDTLLFELEGNRRPRFIERTLESDPAAGVLLEDARVSSFRMMGRDPRTGRFKTENVVLLGFTVYARHGGMDERTSRNAFVRLQAGGDGIPKPERDGDGRLKMVFMSPEPVRLPGDGPAQYAFVDAKNGIILPNARGSLRLHSRYRYQQADPRLPEGFRPSYYAEQSYPLPENFLHQELDWQAIMAHAQERETLRADDLNEHYPERSIWPGSGKGHGPGAQPIRIQRRGSRLFVSEGWGHPWIDAGGLPALARAYLPDHKTRFLSFDHEIRFLNVGGKRKRVYTLSIKLWDEDLDRIIDYHADAVQPQADYETQNPGVPDLWHVYPTGRIVRPDGVVDTYEGAADSNVVRRRWYLPRLLTEMSSKPTSRTAPFGDGSIKTSY